MMTAIRRFSGPPRNGVRFLALLTALSGVAAAAATPAPNIIFILADDLGYGDLGIYGQAKMKTPNVDALAGEGMRFTNHYAGNTVCAPSRAALMTGLHMGHAPIRNNTNGAFIPASTLTVAEILKQAGYATGCIGKWGLGDVGDAGVAVNQGFDLFYGYYDQTAAHDHYPASLYRNTKVEKLDGKTYSEGLFNEEALNFIEQNKSRPFFLYLAYTLPHAQIQAPSKGIYAGKPWPDSEKVFAAMVSYMDSGVGLVMKKVKDLGLDGNTLVFFASDNGPHKEDHDPNFFDSNGELRGIKRDGYEGGIRIPLIARWQGKITAGAVTDLPSYFPDFMPTVCDIIGYHAPAGIDGLSYAPTLFGQTQNQAHHDYMYWEFKQLDNGYNWTAARMGDWKVVQDKLHGTYELFDLSTDLGETKNLAAQFPAVADSMRAILTAAHTDGSPLIAMPLPVGLHAAPGTAEVRPGRSHRPMLGIRRDGRTAAAHPLGTEGDSPSVDARGKMLPEKAQVQNP